MIECCIFAVHGLSLGIQDHPAFPRYISFHKVGIRRHMFYHMVDMTILPILKKYFLSCDFK